MTGVWPDPLRRAAPLTPPVVLYPPPKAQVWSLDMLRRLWALDGARTRLVAPAQALEALSSAFPDREAALAALERMEVRR